MNEEVTWLFFRCSKRGGRTPQYAGEATWYRRKIAICHWVVGPHPRDHLPPHATASAPGPLVRLRDDPSVDKMICTEFHGFH